MAHESLHRSLKAFLARASHGSTELPEAWAPVGLRANGRIVEKSRPKSARICAHDPEISPIRWRGPIAIVCCAACKSQPIIRISASFDPNAVRVDTAQSMRAVVRPTSL